MLDSDAPTSGAENTATTQDGETTPAAPPRRRRAASRPAGPPAPAPEPQPEPVPEPEPPSAAESVEPDAEELVAQGPAEAGPELEEAVVGTEEAAAPGEPGAEESAVGESAEGPQESEQVEEPAAEQAAVESEAPEPSPEPARRRRRATRAAGQPVPVAETTPEGRTPAPRTRRGEARRAELEGRSAASELEAGPQPAALEGPLADAVGEQLAELAERPARRRVAERVANPFSSADVSAALDDLAAAISGGHPAQVEGGAEEEEPLEPDELAGSDTEPFDEDAPRRRRRRRGGRRRRRGADAADDEGEASDEGVDEEEPEGAASGEGEPTGDAEAHVEATGRRRRRRRRRGEDTAEGESEDGVDVVVKVREPRKPTVAPSDQITGIEGSTRMEAKKQRRREGRAAGRRRAPILSEAEFLARREAVERQMLIRQADDYTQIAVLEDGILVEHYVDRDSAASMIGNIYLGRVQNVLPSMEAAFIDIGRGRNAVIYAGEVDWDAFGVSGAERKVEKVLKSGQAVLVQVTKDPVGAKGARLTSHISIPGRYVVYAPGGHLSGISRKLPENERARLKGILDTVVGEDASVIVRTAAEGASEEELVRDVSRLKVQWELIEKKVKAGQAPQQLYSEPDLTVRIVRDLFTEDFGALIVDGNGRGEDAFDTVQAYVTHVAPHLQERLRHWDRAGEGDLFDRFRVHEQVAKALERKVHLPSGGSLIIDRTEAMTVIDVNTGKFTGTQGNLEATVTSNNLEAAEEIVRQLRLRDIGGIIVIDFIDMVLPANRELLLRRLVECLGRDRTRHQVAEVTSLGLVQMTRKKIGTGLHEAFTVPCETCAARGYHVHESPVSTQAPADGGERYDNSTGRRGRGPAARNDQRRPDPRPTPPAAHPTPAPGTDAPAPDEPAPDAQAPAEVQGPEPRG